jgi:hypothetical protein
VRKGQQTKKTQMLSDDIFFEWPMLSDEIISCILKMKHLHVKRVRKEQT